MKTFGEFLELKEAGFKSRFDSIYGSSNTPEFSLSPRKGYQHYLNLFSQRAKEQNRELSPQELAALKQHRKNDAEYEKKTREFNQSAPR